MRFVTAVSVLTAAFLVITLFSTVGAASESGQKLVTVHDRGQERGFITSAATLGDALKEKGITLDKNDIVEPGLTEELDANSYQVNIYRARPVVIADGNVRQLVMSAYQTPEQIASHAGIDLRDEDDTSVDLTNNMVRDGASLTMTIDRATPVQLQLYGKQQTIYTQARDVKGLLREKSITLGPQDDLSLPQSTTITPNMALNIWRNGKQTITQEEPVAFETEKINDANKDVGFKQVTTTGQNGTKVVTYEIVMQNGIEVSRTAIQQVVTKQPSKQVEVVGTKASNTFGGSFAEALARLRSCEGGYTTNTGNGYYGAYQFDRQTWGGYGGFAVASDAPAAVQDEKAWQTYQRRGWQPWPSCKNKMGLQDIYR